MKFPHVLILSCFIFIHNICLADPARHFLDFIYVNSNIGEAAGGHTAIRFDQTVFHYQFYPDGKFLLVRESWQHFLLVYHELRNRSIYKASLPLKEPDYNRLKKHFTQLLIKQKQLLESEEKFEKNILLVNKLKTKEKQLAIPRLGLFETSNTSTKVWLFSALMSEILSKIEHALLIRNGGLPDF